MTKKGKAGDIGAGMDPFVAKDHIGGVFVQLRHGGDQLLMLGRGQETAPLRIGQDTGADGLGKDQGVTGTDAVVPQDPVRVNEASNAEAVLGDRVLDGMAPYHDGASLPDLIVAPLQDVMYILVGQAFREHEDVHGKLCFAAHGPDIGKGVGGGYLTVFVGIVHSRREDIHRLDQSHIISDLVNCSVVCSIISD